MLKNVNIKPKIRNFSKIKMHINIPILNLPAKDRNLRIYIYVFFFFFTQTWSCYVTQAVLKLLGLRDLTNSAFIVAKAIVM